jgi:hypothetical protein
MPGRWCLPLATPSASIELLAAGLQASSAAWWQCRRRQRCRAYSATWTPLPAPRPCSTRASGAAYAAGPAGPSTWWLPGAITLLWAAACAAQPAAPTPLTHSDPTPCLQATGCCTTGRLWCRRWASGSSRSALITHHCSRRGATAPTSRWRHCAECCSHPRVTRTPVPCRAPAACWCSSRPHSPAPGWCPRRRP